MSTRKTLRREKIKMRIRKSVSGDSQIPRLCVFRSNKEIYAQLIDDAERKTLLSASSMDKEVSATKVTKSELAKQVGKLLAEKAAKAGISAVRFDRNGFLYHGRVKSLADGAREGGLKF